MSSLSIIQQELRQFHHAKNKHDKEIAETEIWQTYGKTGVVCVIDMCGFTKAAQEHGIVAYLSMVKRMQHIVQPIIEQYAGSVVKFEADNCFAEFTDIKLTISALKDIFQKLNTENTTSPDSLDIHISVGIDYGRYLLLENDYWGNTVNPTFRTLN